MNNKKTTKRHYAKPSLQRLGNVSELTAGGSKGGQEGTAMSSTQML